MAKTRKTTKRKKKASKKNVALGKNDEEKMAFLKSIFNAITDGVTVIDGNCNLIYINRSLMHFYGYRDPKDIIGKKCYDIFRKRKRKCKHCPAIKVFDTGKPRHMFHSRTDKHGNESYWELYFYPIFDDKGGVTRVVEYSRNITREKKLKEEVKASERRLSELMSITRDIVAEVDANMKCVFISENVKDFAGYTSKEFLSAKSFLDFLTPESKKLSLKYFKNRMAGKPAPELYEFEFVNKKGEVIPVEARVALRKDGDKVLGSVATVRDVTERKTAEETLRESEERFRGIAERSFDAIFEMDSDGRFVYISPSAERISGYKRKEILGKKIQDFLPESEIDRVDKIFGKLVRGRKPRKLKNITVKITKRDGTAAYLEMNATPITRNGEVLGLQGIARDITERMKAEQELKLTQFSVDNAGDAAFWVGPDAGFIYVNDAACRSLGYTHEELLAMTVHDVDPNFPTEVWPDHWKEVKERGSFTFESKHRKKDGTIFPVEITVNYLEYGGKEFNCAYARDISERRKAEEALKESEEKFRSLAEQSPNMIFINKKGAVLYANEECEKIMGYTREEFYSPGFGFFALIAPESIDLVKKSFSKHMKGEEMTPYEYTLITRDGKRIDAIITTKLISYGGEPAILGIVTDITERKHAEEEIRKLKEFNESIVQSMKQGIMILDEDGYVNFVNPEIEKMLGYKRTKLIGEHWANIIAPDYHRRIRDCYAENFRGEHDRFEAVLIKKNRTELPVSISASPQIKDGAFKGVLAVITDISERKREDIAREELMRYKIRRGSTYLIEEKELDRGKDVVYELYKHHFKGVIITREHPEKINKDIDLKLPLYWMTNDPRDKMSVKPEFPLLEKIIDDNIDRNTFVFLDRFDYLVTQNSFKEALNFVQHLNELFYARKAILVISLDPDTITTQELSLLEKETTILEKRHEERLSADLLDLLELVNNRNRVGESPSYKQVGDEFNISRTTARKRIRELIDRGLLMERKSGRFKYLVLTEKGKDSL